MAPALSSALIVACVTHLAAGLRRAGKRSGAQQNQSMSVASASNCEELKDLMVGEVKVGPAAQTVCRFWPKKYGEFPVQSIDRGKELFSYGFAEGGLYDQLQDLAEERGKNSDFCWRAEKDFVPFDCFKFDDHYKPDMEGQKRSKEPTDMWCQKRCAMTTGCKHFSYWSWDKGCHLQGSNAYDSGKSFFRNPTSGPANCSTKSVPKPGDRPIMKCPDGFQPSGLLNIFESVCSQTCEGTEFPVGCGHGCASDHRACAASIMDQVSTVAKTVGKMAAFLTGNQALFAVVEKMLSLVEFLITTFWQLVRTGKELWAEYEEAESFAAFLTVFMAFVKNNGEAIGQTIETIEAMFGDVISFWMDMMEGGFKWRSINLGFIADTIDSYGEGILDGAFGIASAFTYPVCEA